MVALGLGSLSWHRHAYIRNNNISMCVPIWKKSGWLVGSEKVALVVVHQKQTPNFFLPLNQFRQERERAL